MRVRVVVLEDHSRCPALGDLLVHMALDKRYELTYGSGMQKPTSSNRNRIARDFITASPDTQFLMMIDHDTVPRGNPLDLVEKDLDIVVFPAPIWRPDDYPDTPLIWNLVIKDDDGKVVQGFLEIKEPLIEVAGGGTGAILIARRVLEHPDMKAPFEDHFDKDGIRVDGHDLSFCRRAKAAGFRVWAAISHSCSHYKVLDLREVYNWLVKTGKD